MDPALFEQLHAVLAGSQIYAMVTAKDGVLIDEYYQEGYDESSVFALHSCSKSFTGALVGIAIEQGYFGGVDDLLSDYLPQVASLEEGKRQLTLRHLLTHTSGLEWYEWGGGRSNGMEFQLSLIHIYVYKRQPLPLAGRLAHLQHDAAPVRSILDGVGEDV